MTKRFPSFNNPSVKLRLLLTANDTLWLAPTQSRPTAGPGTSGRGVSMGGWGGLVWKRSHLVQNGSGIIHHSFVHRIFRSALPAKLSSPATAGKRTTTSVRWCNYPSWKAFLPSSCVQLFLPSWSSPTG